MEKMTKFWDLTLLLPPPLELLIQAPQLQQLIPTLLVFLPLLQPLHLQQALSFAWALSFSFF